MAIYHFTAKVISRGAGQSVVAAAAYQARERLYNEQDGQTKNYTQHGQQPLLESGIFAPKNAPEWAFDREKLWNAAEKAEDTHNRTRKRDAQTARHLELSLPHELDAEQNRRLLQDFIRENFVRKGYACDVAIHGPDPAGDARNIHAHVLVTMRTLTAEGFSAQKPRLEQAEQRVQLECWRENWARLTSRHLERAGYKMEAARMIYAHRTLEQQQEIAKARGDYEHAQALNRTPTLHEGPTATQMKLEGRGARSWLVAFNQQAANDQDHLNSLRADYARADAALDRAYYANTPEGRQARLARIHEWQRDRLERQQERERLRQADAHAWARRNDATATPVVKEWSEQQRAAEASALERDLDAIRAALAGQQAAQMQVEENLKTKDANKNEPAPVRYHSQAQHFRRVALEHIRRANQSDAARERDEGQARYYRRIMREQNTQHPPQPERLTLEPVTSPAPSETTSARAERLARRVRAMNKKRRENLRDFDYTRDRSNESEP